MLMSWKLGRVAGIDVYLHPTFLLILAFPHVLEGGLATVVLLLPSVPPTTPEPAAPG